MLGRGSWETGLAIGTCEAGAEVGVNTGGSVGILGRAEDGGRVATGGLVDTATRFIGCSSVGSSRFRFRELTDGGISFPSRGRGAYEPLFMGTFQFGRARSDSFTGGDGSFETGDNDGNGGVGPKLGEMRSAGGVLGSSCSLPSGTKEALW